MEDTGEPWWLWLPATSCRISSDWLLRIKDACINPCISTRCQKCFPAVAEGRLIVLGRRKGWGLALVATFLLVLQSVVGAFAFGEMPVSTQLDAFGNPLCISEHHPDTGDHDGGDRHQADCCLLGCSMSTQLLATIGDAGAVLPIPQSAGAFQTPPSEIQFRTRGHHPGYPRAPPTLIA